MNLIIFEQETLASLKSSILIGLSLSGMKWLKRIGGSKARVKFS